MSDIDVNPTTINPDGTPGHVVSGELIESAWGNAVSDSIVAIVTRRGAAASHTGQNIPGATEQAMAWPTEIFDSDNYFGGPGSTDFIIPVGRAGTYGITVRIAASAATTVTCGVTIRAAAQNYITYIPATFTEVGFTIVKSLLDTNVVQCKVYNAHGTALFFSGSIELARLSS